MTSHLLRKLVYVAAAVALWLLWDSPRDALWWVILIAAILTFWTAATIRTAVRDAAKEDPIFAVDPGLAAYPRADGSTDVVRFWVKVNIGITATTLILSILGIALALA